MKNSMLFLDVDGHLLQTLIAIYDESSVSGAAKKLGVSQSTLSHRLERLRIKLNDPIFVRSGRGIVPTARTEQTIGNAKEALLLLSTLQTQPDFKIADLIGKVVIASTDLERSFFLFDAYKAIKNKAPNLIVQFIWEQEDFESLMCENLLDFTILNPNRIKSKNLHTEYLFSDRLAIFYDEEFSTAPLSHEAYLDKKHVKVEFGLESESVVDIALLDQGYERKVTAMAPSFAELKNIIKGSNLVATVPSLTGRTLLQGLSHCPHALLKKPVDFVLCWHDRTHMSPQHNWVKSEIVAAAKRAINKR